MPLQHFTYTHNDSILHQCKLCRVNSPDLKTIIEHARYNHPEIKLPDEDVDIGTWALAQSKSNTLQHKKIALCFLTWNTARASWSCAGSMNSEHQRLRYLGIESKIFAVDNGSTDETMQLVTQQLQYSDFWLTVNPENVGQSTARNQILDEVVKWGADYVFMVDGDIEVIPYSAFAMATFLEKYASSMSDFLKIGCLGLLAHNCTSDDTDIDAAHSCRSITDWMVRNNPHIAWTQYGMFLGEMFTNGMRLDASPVFQGPGWGMEDDELYLQMKNSGYDSWNTNHFRYFHRNRHSSLPLLGRTLAAKVFNARQQYVLNKWKGIPSVARELASIQVQRFMFPKIVK